MQAILETDEEIKRRKKRFSPIRKETDEQIKKRKKGMGSKNHSLIQLAIITQMVLNYNQIYKAVPELSLDINGKEKIPDLSIYKNSEIVLGKDEIRMKALPIAAIEILSPTQALSELLNKLELYFDAGILSYWVVLPEVQSIYVYSDKSNFEVYTQKDTLIDSHLKIELNLATIF